MLQSPSISLDYIFFRHKHSLALLFKRSFLSLNCWFTIDFTIDFTIEFTIVGDYCWITDVILRRFYLYIITHLTLYMSGQRKIYSRAKIDNWEELVVRSKLEVTLTYDKTRVFSLKTALSSSLEVKRVSSLRVRWCFDCLGWGHTHTQQMLCLPWGVSRCRILCPRVPFQSLK